MTRVGASVAVVVVTALSACALELDTATEVEVVTAGIDTPDDERRAAFTAMDVALGLDLFALEACPDDDTVAGAPARARALVHRIARALDPVPKAHAAHLESTPSRAVVATTVRPLDDEAWWAALSPPATRVCEVRVGAYGDEAPVLTVDDGAERSEARMADERTFSVALDLAATPRVSLVVRFAPSAPPPTAAPGLDVAALEALRVGWAMDALTVELRAAE